MNKQPTGYPYVPRLPSWTLPPLRCPSGTRFPSGTYRFVNSTQIDSLLTFFLGFSRISSCTSCSCPSYGSLPTIRLSPSWASSSATSRSTTCTTTSTTTSATSRCAKAISPSPFLRRGSPRRSSTQSTLSALPTPSTYPTYPTAEPVPPTLILLSSTVLPTTAVPYTTALPPTTTSPTTPSSTTAPPRATSTTRWK